ncbi:MAG: GIY-YIG nuclease family protein [Gemmatimonadales bacterium]
MRSRQFFVYILASTSRVLYIGVTNDLDRRIAQHRSGLGGGFSRRYQTHRLVFFEIFDRPRTAIAREKQLKGWKRSRKLALIEEANPHWKDLGAGSP